MLNLKQSIGAIEGLLEEGSDASITYAALECRLTIERICYERLRVSHDYISTADIKRWQPHSVVNVLLQEVDKEIASTFTVLVSADVPKNPEPTKEDYEELSFSTLGTQVGFNANKLGKLWNALSKLALHITVPTSKNDSIPLYGENDKSKAKVIESLTEIRRISKGTLVSAGMLSTGGNVTFTCECGAENKRRDGLLKEGQMVSCINPVCRESYDFERREDGSWFTRRIFEVRCNKCETIQNIPKRLVEELKTHEHIPFNCIGEQCDEKIVVMWRAMQAQLSSSAEH